MCACVPVHDLPREISYVATEFREPAVFGKMGNHGFSKEPDVTIIRRAAEIPPRQHDVLPLYIVLMLFLPLILWLMKWRADVTLALSACSMP